MLNRHYRLSVNWSQQPLTHASTCTAGGQTETVIPFLTDDKINLFQIDLQPVYKTVEYLGMIAQF